MKRLLASTWPRFLELGATDPRTGLCEVPIHVGVGPAARPLGDLDVAKACDFEREIPALSYGELGEATQRSASLERVVDRGAAPDGGFPSVTVAEVLQIHVAVCLAEVVRLVDGDDP